jgi:TolB-like protein/Tfp pilus assembly protein PilF
MWLDRLRERGVIRVAASYAVIAWLLLQIADVTFEPLGVPRWVMVSLIVAALIGFPVAIAFAWFYEAGDQGLTRDTAAEGVPRPVVHGLRRYADVGIIGVLLAVIAALLVRQSDLAGPGSGRPAIAVLPFQNVSSAAEGEVLALGIAESVLHQLANLQQLDVISRTSSFTLGNRQQDAREIGRLLGARYLLEGSVQSDRRRMRVTTQLIDTSSGADVWSMRFDRLPGDVFEVQDQIALQVTQALELALDPEARKRMSGQGTENLEAYLAFLQGRARLATANLTETTAAIENFERALQLDPQFASAYVKLAEAGLRAAEFDVTGDRTERFEAAHQRAEELVKKALSLDPDNGDAYLQRAYVRAFTDLASAEADYRRGLELSPNSAAGYAGLAAVVYQAPARRDETLALLDRARKLDPLDLSYDVLKAGFLMYERSDVQGAEAILVDVVKRDPGYTPALARLAEVRAALSGQVASGIRYAEEALARDPPLENTRRLLIGAYLDLRDRQAAERVAGFAEDRLSPRGLWILLEDAQWQDAGEAAYASLARGLDAPMSVLEHVLAIRMHARATGDFVRAETALTQLSGVRWTASGDVVLPQDTFAADRDSAIALADVLIAGERQEKGKRLLSAIIERWRHEVGALKRPEFWYWGSHPVAFALAGDREAALAMLERSAAHQRLPTRGVFRLENDPAFAELRDDPRFQAVVSKWRMRFEQQRKELDRMRAEGLVPGQDEDHRAND